MTKPYIPPIGFITQTTDDGAAFTLSNAEDSVNLSRGTPVTVWRYSPEQRDTTGGVGQNPGTHNRRRICDGDFQNSRVHDRPPVAGGRTDSAR